MSIIKKKTWAIIVLVSFMLTLLPVPAMAAGVPNKDKNPLQLEIVSGLDRIKNGECKLGEKVTLTFQFNKDANLKTDINHLSLDFSNAHLTIAGSGGKSVINFVNLGSTGVFTQEVQLPEKIDEYTMGAISYKYTMGQSTGSGEVYMGTSAPIKFTIAAGDINVEKSIMSVDYNKLDDKGASATVRIDLKDSEGNPTSKLPFVTGSTTETAKIWIWGKDVTIGEIGGLTPASDGGYITTSSSAITIKITGSKDGKVYWGIGEKPEPANRQSIDVYMSIIELTIVNSGKMTTHVSKLKPAMIKVDLSGTNRQDYYLELPKDFEAINSEWLFPSDNNSPRVIKLSGEVEESEIKIIAVPGSERHTYREITGDANNDPAIEFKLYNSAKEECMFIKKNCEIIVDEETIEVAVKNAGTFRYAEMEPPKEPHKLILSLPKWQNPGRGYSLQVTTSGSSIQIKDGTVFETKIAGGLDLKNFEVPIELTTLKKNEQQDITVNVEIYTMKGGLYAKGQVTFPHKVTGEILKIEDITVGKPSKAEEVVYINGETYNKTVVDVDLKNKPLNGNKLFVWIEDISGEKKDIKEYFAVDVKNIDPDSKVTLKSTNSNVGPGTVATGSSNVFEITSNNSDVDELGTEKFRLIIYSQKPGNFKVHVAIAENAQGITNSTSGEGIFEFIDTKDKPVITLQNDGIIYGGESIKGAGTVKYTIENTTWKQGDTITLQLPPKYHPEFAVTSSQALKVSIPIKLGQPGKDNIFKGTFKLDYAPQPSGNTEVDNFAGWTMLSPKNELADIKFEGGLTITKRAEEAEVLVDIVTSKGFSGDGVTKLLINTDAAGEIVLKDQKSLTGNKLQNKVLLVWLEKDEKLVKDNNHLTITDTKNYTASDGKAEGFDEGTILVKWNADAITGNAMEIPFAVAQFTDKEVGSYQIKAELREIDNTDPQKPQYRPVDKGNGEKSFKVVTTLTDTDWSLAIKLNGDTLSGDNSGVFKSDELALNTKLELEVRLKDKDGNALAEKEVEVSVNKSSLKLTPEKGKTDSNGKVTFTGTPETTTDLDYIVTIKAFEDKDTMATATVTIPIRVEPNNDKDDSNVDTDNLDLQIKGMTDVVARGKTASIYIEAYDDDDDLVKVTSDAMAEKIIDRVRLIDTPTSSDLRSSDVYFKRSGDGIVVYFYPDVTGYYEVRIEGAGNDPTVLTPEITAIRQNDKIVRMELEYNETTLGIGRRSSPAIIYTYDEDGNKAQRSLLDSRLEITSSGSAVENLSPMGVVSVKNSDRYAGQTIRVMVVDERNNLSAEWVFNVDEYSSSGDKNNDDLTNVKDIVLWDNYGGVGMTNRIQFYLTDESGFRTILEPGQLSSGNNASATVSIASKPAGATVTASIYNNGRTLEDDGYGYLDVYSSKEGIVRLNLTFKVYNPEDSKSNWKRYDYYRKTVEIHMTKNITSSNIGFNWADIGNNNSSNSSKNNKHDVSVAMFVGSPIYTVNMLQKEMDTAPYIDGGRTYIPIRTLSDSLGALTDYDSKDQKITIVYGAERVEMQIGSNVVTTTRKGSYRTDVAPVIQDGRTMIPLRTAAEALGCDVEAVTDQYGSTLGAVFSK